MSEAPFIVEAAQWLLIAISLAFGGWVAVSWRSTGQVLPYEPRWPVPWGAVGGVGLAGLMLMLVLMAQSSSSPLVDEAAHPPKMSDDEFIALAIQNAGFIAILTGMVLVSLHSSTQASSADFGFDNLTKHWRKDVKLGAGAALFAFGPVYLVHIAAALVVGSPSQNPTLVQIASSTNAAVWAAAFFAAVVAAPVCEELIFRSLLQGWLERVEDELLGWRNETDDTSALREHYVNFNDESTASQPDRDNPYAAPSAPPSVRVADRSKPTETPPKVTYGGLSHGWGPILLSGLAFALVHLGAGPDPIPLLLFGVIVGYVYQRTHRLLACVVCHMLFNGVSLSLALAATLLA